MVNNSTPNSYKKNYTAGHGQICLRWLTWTSIYRYFYFQATPFFSFRAAVTVKKIATAGFELTTFLTTRNRADHSVLTINSFMVQLEWNNLIVCTFSLQSQISGRYNGFRLIIIEDQQLGQTGSLLEASNLENN